MPVPFRRLAVFVLAAFSSLGCSGGAFSVGEPAADGAATDGAREAGPPDVVPSSDGGSPEAAEAARDTGPKSPIELNLPVSGNADDATWINGTDERLSFGPDNPTLEVGVDSEMGRVGLRFVLPIPRGSTIGSARLRLRRVEGSAAETESMQVQVFDTGNVAPFDEAHVHGPAGHAPIWPGTVSGFVVGANGKEIDSPDIKLLVQHVVDLSGWSESGHIGLLLLPDQMAGWVAFADSSGTAGPPALRVVYTPP